MPKTRLAKLEKLIESAEDISAAKKAEILALIAQLREELDEKNPAEKPDSTLTKELRDQVAEFEVEHPDLVELTNRACNMLSDMGI